MVLRLSDERAKVLLAFLDEFLGPLTSITRESAILTGIAEGIRNPQRDDPIYDRVEWDTNPEYPCF